MTVNTGINNALLKPSTYHVLTYLRAGRALTPLPQRCLLIGVRAVGVGTAVSGAIIPVDDPSQAETLFGQGTLMTLMIRKAMATSGQLGSGPAFFACPVDDVTTAQVELFTITGAATADSNIIIRIAGRFFTVGIANGTTAVNAGVALDTAIKAAYSDLPVTSSNAGGVVTLTHTVKGTTGNDTVFEVVSMPAGLVGGFTVSAAGVGAPNIQPGLDAMAGQDFDVVATPTHIAGDITKINTTLATRFSPSEKKPSWFFVGEPGTIATATALAANHEGIVVGSWNGSRSLPGEIAAAMAAGATSKSLPNANYDGMTLPLYPPTITNAYTNAQIETALNAGLTPLAAVIDPGSRAVVEGQGSIVRLITSRTTMNSQTFILLRDFGVSRTAWYMAKQYDIAYANKFGAGASNPNGVLLTADTMLQIKDMITNINKAAEDSNILYNVDSDLSRLIVEADATTSGRVNVDVQYTIVVGLHQVAFVHRAQI